MASSLPKILRTSLRGQVQKQSTLPVSVAFLSSCLFYNSSYMNECIGWRINNNKTQVN
jgi:hypothetical protein